MEPISLFPAPPSPFQYHPTTPPSESIQSLWKTYWMRFLWYMSQGGRVAVSLGIASLVWIVFSMLPGVLAWIITGQYDVKIKHTKKE